MSDVQSSTSATTSTWTTTTTSTSTTTTTSAELQTSTLTSTTAPMSSSSTITSESSTTPLLPSISTPVPLTSLLFPSSPTSSSASTSSSISSSISTVPAIMSTLVPTTATPTIITTSITITPTSIITTTTTTISSPTIPTSTSTPTTPTSTPSTTTTTVTLIPPSTSADSTNSTSTSRPSTSFATSRTSSSADTGPPSTNTTSVLFTSRTMSTFSSMVYISTTDDHGSTTIYAPPFITSKTTFMGPGNTPTTSTTIIANPTLNPDTSSPSSFFQNRGAVAGVFTLVGLAVISITIWIIFFIRRRRREMSLEHDTAVSASLAAAGFNRTPLEDASSVSSRRSRYGSAEFLATPMANPDSERHRRSTSRLLENNNGRMSIMPDTYHEDRGRYDPFIEYNSRNSRDSYRDMPSPTTPHLNAPLSAFVPYRDRNSSDGMGMVEVGAALPMGPGIVHTHHAHHSSSGGSLEPLLARSNGPERGPLLLTTNLSNGRASRTPSTENGSSASTSKQPSYLPSLNQPNSYGTNDTSNHSAIFDNGREEHLNSSMGANEPIKRLGGDVPGDSEVSTAEDEFELDLQKKPVLAVRNLPDAASTVSLS